MKVMLLCTTSPLGQQIMVENFKTQRNTRNIHNIKQTKLS